MSGLKRSPARLHSIGDTYFSSCGGILHVVLSRVHGGLHDDIFPQTLWLCLSVGWTECESSGALTALDPPSLFCLKLENSNTLTPTHFMKWAMHSWLLQTSFSEGPAGGSLLAHLVQISRHCRMRSFWSERERWHVDGSVRKQLISTVVVDKLLSLEASKFQN